MLVQVVATALLLWADTDDKLASPRLLHRQTPAYTRQALDAGVQGTVVLDFTIDEEGKVRGIEMLSPLGFGLDEASIQALESWRFSPAKRSGQPQKFSSQAEFHFRLEGQSYDRKREEQRTRFNRALAALHTEDKNRRAGAIGAMQELSRSKFGPAMYMTARLIRQKEVTGDKTEERRLISEAAKQDYGPAIFETGAWLMNGDGVPQETEAGLKLIREASVLGSLDAQRTLGKFAASGQFGPKSLDDAKRYYRLCATGGLATCQEELGLLLLGSEPGSERHYLQAVAWLELAVVGGRASAKSVAETETAKLTPVQRSKVDRLKAQLLQRPQ